MADDMSVAFGPLVARAAAFDPENGQPRDRISVRDHLEHAEIGAFQAERGTRQGLRFNVVVEVTPPGRQVLDDVDRILSYDLVTDAIRAELARARRDLLETLADQIAARILREPKAARVFVRIEKLDRGPGALGVEIMRERALLAERAAGCTVGGVPDMPGPGIGSAVGGRALYRPNLVYLDPQSVDDATLFAWLDALQAAPGPAILCVPPVSGIQRPAARRRAAQWRIDLLAIEQAAWVLAARDERCQVVASRTELDWALAQGKITVWAPSKMVLDAADRRALTGLAAPALALWLATQTGARRAVALDLAWPDPDPGTEAVSVAAADVGAGL